MQQRQTGKPPANTARKGTAAAPAEAAAPATTPADATTGAGGDKQIRTVGPTFIPTR